MAGKEDMMHRMILSAMQEDIGSGDHSTLCCIPANAKGSAKLLVKESGILAGLDIARSIFLLREPTAVFMPFMADGEAMRPGDIAFEISATVHTILACERLVLNTMQRMSGIATLTSAYTEILKPYKTEILDTRKTTPNFRVFEKEAVRIGGGKNHRMGLYDMIMLKDNHIDFAGGIPAALEQAWEYVQRYHPELKIEVETRNLEEVRQALGTGKVHRIMLDNFTIEALMEALHIIDGRVETEASGGINLTNLEDYAKTGVDYISAGALIHQARSLDLSLKAVF